MGVGVFQRGKARFCALQYERKIIVTQTGKVVNLLGGKNLYRVVVLKFIIDLPP